MPPGDSSTPLARQRHDPDVVESLQLAEERFRSAFDEAPIGMALVSLEGRFMKVNRSLCELIGYSEEELIQLNYQQITHLEDVDADRRYTAQMLNGEIRTYQMEKRYLAADGEEIWVHLSVSLVRDLTGEPVYFISQTQDITERRALEAQLRHLADHDPLTGLLNRRGLEAELAARIGRLDQIHDGRGALILLDLDHFKSVNNTLGHRAGDRLIVTVAALLVRRLRSTDRVARLGGDEFAVLLPDADGITASHVADSIIREIREHATVLAGRHHHRVTASAGVALLAAGVVGVEDAFVNADLALYDAKEAGRDRIAVHAGDSHDPSRTQSRLAWIHRIREAIADERFTFHLQPIVGLQSGTVRQYELLLRMIDEDGALVAPGAFLSVAERYGLIGELDRWVARQAVRMIAERAKQGEQLILEVNLSGRSLGDATLLQAIEHELKETGVDPAALIFEVTETAAVANFHLAREFADKLTALGCRFALDDFGAGFGSFYYLKHIPFDYLKIDGEFVTRCTSNRTDQFVIKALVGIAQGLDKQTIAECVEDEDTLRFLRSNGVDFAQGNHLGRPRPLSFPRPVLSPRTDPPR